MLGNIRKKILIVEDNDLNRKLFQDLLEVQEFEVIATGRGSQAISIMEKDHPDLVLMDIGLPDVSGLDVVAEIVKNDKINSIPVIALTAFAMQNDREKCLKSGCRDYISKPISIDSFFNTVNTYING